MKNVRRGIAAAIVLVAVVHGQSAMTGTWQGESPNGSKVVLNAKATATTLTGTLSVDGQQLTLVDGKLSKNTLTFTVMLPPNNAAQAFTGELADDQMKLWMDQRGPANAAVLKRVKQ